MSSEFTNAGKANMFTLYAAIAPDEQDPKLSGKKNNNQLAGCSKELSICGACLRDVSESLATI